MKKVFVIGKKSQLGSLLNGSIIAALLTAKEIEKNDEVLFCTIEKPAEIPKQVKNSGVKKTLLIGLKSTTIDELLNFFVKEKVGTENMVTHIEGKVPTSFNPDHNIKYFPELKDIAA